MKKLKYIIFSIICLNLGLIQVAAASIEMSVTSSTITKGTNVIVTAKFVSNSSIFFTEGTLTCSGAGVNKTQSLNDDDMSKDKTSKSFSLNITPTTTGKVTCSISNARLTDSSSSEWINVSTNAKTITVNAPVTTTPSTTTKSSNNNLVSLSIDNYELDKTFSKDTLEYNVEIKPEDLTIKVNAQTADSTAKVTGTGEITLNPGTNKIEVKVTAQNGNVKTYVINATLKEYKNIEVEIDNKKYTIVRKNDNEALENYQETTVTIDEEEVLAYYNDITKFTLVLLKDENDNIDYYIYNNGKYTLYKEYDFSGLKLYILDLKEKDNLILSELELEDDKIKAYALTKNKNNTTYALQEDEINYYLIYAMNVKTGKEDYYLIDKLENTALRYTDELNTYLLDTKVEEDNYKLYFYIVLGVLGISLVVIAIVSMVKKKSKRNFK